MLKESIICLSIVIVIFLGNYMTQNYTIESIDEIENKLNNIRIKLESNKEQINQEEIENDTNEVKEEWRERYEKLAYFIEHDELEKVETNITGIRGEIEYEDYGEVISKIDQTIFIMNHIEDKYAFTLQNIF